MSTMKDFLLPDLGEGLPDAEIVEWLVKEGDTVMLDQPLVSMETAKAVVEVPSPFSGTVVARVGEMVRELLRRGASLQRLDPRDLVRLAGIGREAVDGLRGQHDQPTPGDHGRGRRRGLRLLRGIGVLHIDALQGHV